VKPWLIALVLVAEVGCAHRYPIEGIVIEKDSAARRIVVAHRPVDNYMPAMTMPFKVGREVPMDRIMPGTRVGFQLKVGKHGSVAQNVQIRAQTLQDSDGTPIAVKTPPNKLSIGEKCPDFSLLDQAERKVSLSDFRGRAVVIDFIYTRCPLPDVCPRLSANFASVSKAMHGKNVEFLSITIDPQYDTPSVLREYAKRWRADGESWKLLTGTGDQIRDVAGMFGLVYWPEEGSITHTVATAVIRADGTLAARIDGAGYRPDQLRALVENVVNQNVLK
jgi:protein SCO1/2